MSVSIKEKRRQLIERYQQCTPAEQAAVNLLAVAWSGLSKSQIADHNTISQDSGR